jgi:hypothetical protein
MAGRQNRVIDPAEHAPRSYGELILRFILPTYLEKEVMP